MDQQNINKKLRAEWVEAKLNSIEAMLKKVLEHLSEPKPAASRPKSFGKEAAQQPKERLLYELDEETGALSFKRIWEDIQTNGNK